MKPLAKITTTDDHGVAVVHLDGEVDLSNAEDVRRAVFDAADAAQRCLVIDLTSTTYLDSTAVRVMFDLAVRMQTRRRPFRLVVSDATIVRRVLILTRLDEAVPFDTTVEAAVAACTDNEEPLA